MRADRPGESYWNPKWRVASFALAASSLACLMADFYGVCSMRLFAIGIFTPAMAALAVLAIFGFVRGDGKLGRAVVIGAAAGLGAAVAYDVFRLPFVYARQWGIAWVVPALNLFKVFPAFGAMLLGQPVQQPDYSTAATVLGWLYHFSNGTTIGVMYVALIGDLTRRSWAWAILLATGLELGMLLTPYPRVFGIPLTVNFVLVTMAAHSVFGVGLGVGVKALDKGCIRTLPPDGSHVWSNGL